MIRVLIYEDITFLRNVLAEAVNQHPEMTCCGQFENPVNVLADIQKCTPDVILMDLQMPKMTGIEAISLLKKNNILIPVVVQTISDDEDSVFDSLCAGADGYILKTAQIQDQLKALLDAVQGGAPMSPTIAIKVIQKLRNNQVNVKSETTIELLSPKEKQILKLLAAGLSQKMIADEVQISIDTVRFHFKNIYKKLQVHSQTEAIAKAMKDKLI